MKRFFFEDLGLKLAAVVLAFGLWVYVGTNQVLEQRVDLKVVFTDMPANAMLSPDVQTTVPVVLVGRRERVGILETENLKAVASLQGVPVPSRDYPVKLQVSNVPKGVAVDLPPFLVTLTSLSQEPPKKKLKSLFHRR